MHRRRFLAARRWHYTTLKLAFAAALTGGLVQVPAQTVTQAQSRPSLREAFEAAWSRQPEAQALGARRDAARAQQQAAQSWTPEPVALELGSKTDRFNHNLGTREYEVGVTIPIWLPGERGHSQALADAEGRAVESRATAAQLRVAATVRETWWSWQRARADWDAARSQLDNARRIAADVRQRVKGGELARADQHQVDGAEAAAQATVAQAEAALKIAQQQLILLTALPGDDLGSDTPTAAEPEPAISATGTGDLDSHAELWALKDRAAVAEGAAALAATQSRASPELKLATTRDRGSSGEPYQQTVTLGVRIPFGAEPRHNARVASARAELIELQAEMARDRVRLAGEREVARVRIDAARAQLAAADRRTQLARESRGFFDTSFRLGQTDLPTRLRVEAEAADAERQAARARIELAAALSAWRQALGLLPQ